MSVFFFFQAEDGIRDYKVTGVQTCALPIYLGGTPRSTSPVRVHIQAWPFAPLLEARDRRELAQRSGARSAEISRAIWDGFPGWLPARPRARSAPHLWAALTGGGSRPGRPAG